MKNTGKELLIITGSSGLIGSALIRRCRSYLIVPSDVADGAQVEATAPSEGQL